MIFGINTRDKKIRNIGSKKPKKTTKELIRDIERCLSSSKSVNNSLDNRSIEPSRVAYGNAPLIKKSEEIRKKNQSREQTVTQHKEIDLQREINALDRAEIKALHAREIIYQREIDNLVRKLNEESKFGQEKIEAQNIKYKKELMVMQNYLSVQEKQYKQEMDDLQRRLETELNARTENISYQKTDLEKELEEIKSNLLLEKKNREQLENDFQDQNSKLEDEIKKYQKMIAESEEKIKLELELYKAEKRQEIENELKKEKELQFLTSNETIYQQEIEHLKKELAKQDKLEHEKIKEQSIKYNNELNAMKDSFSKEKEKHKQELENSQKQIEMEIKSRIEDVLQQKINLENELMVTKEHLVLEKKNREQIENNSQVYEAEKRQEIENEIKKDKELQLRASNEAIYQQKIEDLKRELAKKDNLENEKIKAQSIKYNNELNAIKDSFSKDKENWQQIENNLRKQKVQLEGKIKEYQQIMSGREEEIQLELELYKAEKKLEIENELKQEKEKNLKFIDEWLEIQKSNTTDKSSPVEMKNFNNNKVNMITEDKLRLIDEELDSKRQDALDDIYHWTEQEKNRLQNYFENEYKKNITLARKEIEDRVQEEFKHIHQYFSEFEKEKKLLVENDIKNFLDGKLSKIIGPFDNKEY
ncbi:MAG: hypothetical protein HQK53_13335 [Oligoflexia bacterium]|nr:hypothetical protein [Oligoflexia bacterium]